MPHLMRTLHGQLALSYGGVVLLAVVFSGVATAVTMRAILLDRIAVDLVGEARILAHQLAEPLSHDDREGVVQQVRHVDPMTTARILVSDRAGNVLASSDPPPGYALSHLSEIATLFAGPDTDRDVVVTRDRGPDGGELVQVSVPIRSANGHIVGILTESYDVEDTRALLWQINALTFLGGASAAVLAAALGFVLAAMVARPVRLASAAVRDLAVRRISPPLTAPAGAPAEVRELLVAVNTLGYQLQLYDQSRREFASDIAHELRSLTSAMQTGAEALARGAGESDPSLGRRLVAGLVGHARRLDRLANDLLELGHLDSGTMRFESERVDLRALAREVANAWLAEAGERNTTLEVSVSEEPVWAYGDPVRLAQALGNLIENALKYAGDGGRIRVTVRPAPEQEGGEIVVEDSGPGIPPDALPRIFDRYFRVEGRSGRGPGGMGLGLAIARGIARAHHGDLRAENAEGSGARFILHVPRVPGPAEASTQMPAPA